MVVSYRIVPYGIVSYRIISYRIAVHCILIDRIVSYGIVSYRANRLYLPCRISALVVSYASFCVISRRIISRVLDSMQSVPTDMCGTNSVLFISVLYLMHALVDGPCYDWLIHFDLCSGTNSVEILQLQL